MLRMIPKTIHLCWLSGDPYPDLVSRCLTSWRKHLPDYEVRLWNRDTFHVDGTPWVSEATACKKYAFAADYIRLHALYHHGGIYLDADVEVLRSFDDLLHLRSFIGHETSGDLEPAIIGAQPGAPWIGHCLAYYNGRRFVATNGERDQRPLPLIIAEVLGAHYQLPVEPVDGCTEVEEAGLHLFGATYFSPKNAHSGSLTVAPHTYTIHHFDGQWVDKGLSYVVKRHLHRALLVAFGQSGHRWLVDAIRRLIRSTSPPAP